MSSDALRHLTSTVGLVCTNNSGKVNLMAAEWTYFVACDPLHIALGIAEYNLTHQLLTPDGEFSVTLCDSSQTALAIFAGSFSGREVDKTSSADVDLAPPEVTSTPYVRGGVLNAECRVRHMLELPGYALVIGEAVATRHDSAAGARPLVKHGAIHELGPVVVDGRVIVAASLGPGYTASGSTLRVAATAHDALATAPWEITVTDDTGRPVLEERWHADGPQLLLDLEVPVPSGPGALSVEVRRGDARPGIARPHQLLPAVPV